MLYSAILVIALVAETTIAFPSYYNIPGVGSRVLENIKRQHSAALPKRDTCPFNPNHVPAAPITVQFPYNNAINGLPGRGQGGFRVPAVGDTAHQYVPPGPNDIRGPCPGLNSAANHNFIPHDGIATFNELVDAQQNIWNVEYAAAVIITAYTVSATDGDPITQKLSIGCDATSRTSFSPLLTGPEAGLNAHNKFEADTSLTRTDYFLAGGDDYSFNATLFGLMNRTCNGYFSRANIARYRSERYAQSLHDNPNFFFGPLAILLFGAASFVYELLPSGPNYEPDLPTISTWFGAVPNPSGTGFGFSGGERIPSEWYNRLTPYGLDGIVGETLAQYGPYPVLFGGKTGDGSFDVLSYGGGPIVDGRLVTPDANSLLCLLYQLLTESVPTSLSGVTAPLVQSLAFVLGKANPIFAQYGCSLRVV